LVLIEVPLTTVVSLGRPCAGSLVLFPRPILKHIMVLDRFPLSQRKRVPFASGTQTYFSRCIARVAFLISDTLVSGVVSLSCPICQAPSPLHYCAALPPCTFSMMSSFSPRALRPRLLIFSSSGLTVDWWRVPPFLARFRLPRRTR